MYKMVKLHNQQKEKFKKIIIMLEIQTILQKIIQTADVVSNY